MSVIKLILTYSFRIVRREWRRFVLPLASLTITTFVLLLILLVTSGSALLLDEQARELLGGDVVIESATPFDATQIFAEANNVPLRISNQLSFSATLESEESTAPFSVQVIDAEYPLYGSFTLRNGEYRTPAEGEIYVDEGGAERLAVGEGDTVSFGSATLTVVGIVVSEPTSLISGFRFLPRAFMNYESFALAQISPELLRVEYIAGAIFDTVSSDQVEVFRALESTYPELDIDIAGRNSRGLQFGLETVRDFLVVALLITAVLTAVNVYVSTLYLVTIERKSLAVLLALGLSRGKLISILGTALLYVVIIAGGLGTLLGILAFMEMQKYLSLAYQVTLPTPAVWSYSALGMSLVLGIAFASFIPAVGRSLSFNPKQILIGGEVSDKRGVRQFWNTFLIITASTLLPLTALAIFLLESVTEGLLVIGSIFITYGLVASLYLFGLKFVYGRRKAFSFFIQTVIRQKKADGLFGVVSFTSLFVALASLCTLALLQVSLERFLISDLSRTVPTTYVLDIQPSQRDALLEEFSDLELFSNIGARIIAIDGLRIQDELERENSDVDRELGREFNLTARTTLLESETITDGVWSEGRVGEVSVDEEFAKRARISLGSTLVFSIQGFEVSARVTSLRSTDSRSGLPFFYFVLSPEDIGQFPSVYFGYSYYSEERQAELGRFIARSFPNISVIETQSIGPLLQEIIGTLTVLILVVSLPPLLIATLLIAMLVISSYATRRREGARLRAIGMSHSYNFWLYITEATTLTLVATVLAYGVGCVVTYLVSIYFFGLESIVWFDMELVVMLGLVIFFICGMAVYLFKTDHMPLRELLSYE